MSTVTHMTVLDQSRDNLLGVRLQGRLEESDLNAFAAELEERGSSNGRLRVLLEMKSIKNYTPTSLWEAVRARATRIEQVERLALVGDHEDYQRWLAELSTSLIEGDVQYFELSELRAAWEWIGV